MKRRTIGELIFLCAAAVALALYFMTVPDGLPWNDSVRLACAYLGCGGRGATALPAGLLHSVWGFSVGVLGGSVALSVLLAALASGFLGAVVNRYFGWRFAAGAALVWIFLPGVWNRAITGERSVCLAAMAVVAVWILNLIALRVTRKARVTRRSAPTSAGKGLGGMNAHGEEKIRGRVNRMAGWVALCAAGLFALVSMAIHDYRFGEAASAYARLVVEEAGDRVILLNGVCDEQVVGELKSKADAEERNPGKRGKQRSSPRPLQNLRFRLGGPRSVAAANGTESVPPEVLQLPPPSIESVNSISFLNTEANRSNIVAWVKREWPGETNLWLAAEISPASFAEVAVKAHPERFYSMMGQSTTLAKWEARWEAMKPYLKSQDPFIPAMRRMFAYEGNVLGNKLQEEKVKTEGDSHAKRAWDLYYRIFTEINPKNPAACVNLNMMLRQGYKVDESTRRRIESEQAGYAKLLADRQKAKHAAEWISHFGPVMRDQKAYEELRERVRKRMEELEKAGDKSALIPDLKTLEEWHAEMMKAFQGREYAKAARIARAILTRKAWRGFVPAYMVIGESMLMKGDFGAAESFLRVAAEATGTAAPPPFVLNDYAETLRQLGRLDEAEKFARRAVKESDEKTGWIFRLTLAEVLEAKGKKDVGDSQSAVEIRDLLKSALKQAPKEVRKKIFKEHKQYLR